MSIEVTMPQMGESVVEGTVTKWLVKQGDRVEEDQPLCEISTDKVDTEIPSPGGGGAPPPGGERARSPGLPQRPPPRGAPCAMSRARLPRPRLTPQRRLRR